MKKTMFAVLAALVMAGGTAANAAGSYVGIGTGVYGLEMKGINGAVINQKGTTWGGYLYAGGDFNRYVGAELRFGLTGASKKSYPAGTWGIGVPFDSKLQMPLNFSYLAKIQYPVNEIKPYLLFGGTTGRIKHTITGVSATKTKTGLSYGLGLDYSMGDDMTLGAEWLQLWKNVTVVNTKISVWGATLHATFHY